MDYTTVVREACYMAVVFPSYLCGRDIILRPLMVFYVLFNINFKHTSMDTMDPAPEQVSNRIRSRAAKQELKTKGGIKTGEDERTRFKSRNTQSDTGDIEDTSSMYVKSTYLPRSS